MMFVRSELKQQAKKLMEKHFPQMFLVCLIAGLLSGDLVNFKFNLESGSVHVVLGQNINLTLAVFTGALFFAAIAASIAFAAFIVAPFQQGVACYFRNITLEKARIEDLLYSFSGNYLHHVKVLFYRDMAVLLWTLLLIIPGIIKGYEYAFVDYILNDHPDIEPDDALEMSSKMTYGLKWEMFVLDLSYILWDLLAGVLSIFTLGLSHIALNVYKKQTHAQLYQWVLEDSAIYKFEEA